CSFSLALLWSVTMRWPKSLTLGSCDFSCASFPSSTSASLPSAAFFKNRLSDILSLLLLSELLVWAALDLAVFLDFQPWSWLLCPKPSNDSVSTSTRAEMICPILMRIFPASLLMYQVRCTVRHGKMCANNRPSDRCVLGRNDADRY